jgi:hypothetical protein
VTPQTEIALAPADDRERVVSAYPNGSFHGR